MDCKRTVDSTAVPLVLLRRPTGIGLVPTDLRNIASRLGDECRAVPSYEPGVAPRQRQGPYSEIMALKNAPLLALIRILAVSV
jgi:hypothetical protein